jgi:CheY-like chemotaxis protein
MTASRPADAPRAKRRVLLVDDRRDAIFSLQMLLKLTGHEVAVASDGPQALSVAEEFGPDIVLCDISLGKGMSGLDVARALRGKPKFADLYLVAVSGHDDDDDRRAALQAGFDYHVSKPVGKERLEQLMGADPPRDSC